MPTMSPKRTASIPLDTDQHTCSYATARSSTNTIAHCQPAVFKTCRKQLCMGCRLQKAAFHRSTLWQQAGNKHA
jgi:hypothetical protein